MVVPEEGLARGRMAAGRAAGSGGGWAGLAAGSGDGSAGLSLLELELMLFS